MLHTIFGGPGAGKSSLVSYFAWLLFKTKGIKIWHDSISAVEDVNSRLNLELTPPPDIPFYSDHEIKFKIGFEKYYSTFKIDGFHLGLYSEKFSGEYIPPNSVVFLSEVQRYYDSRKSNTKEKISDNISRFYEMHRHFNLEIYLDLQRVKLLDLNIRELCQDFILVKGHTNKYSSLGRIIETRWDCLRFDSWSAVEKFLSDNNEKNVEKISYTYKGNIFKTYNSFSYFDEFLPPTGEDFCFEEHK